VLRATPIAWAECGFQLVRTADPLAIHRNTLLYRLTKIEELTGRGVREPRTVMALYLACLAGALWRRTAAPPHSTRLIPTHG
jgi:carbohydrate diacid regulator